MIYNMTRWKFYICMKFKNYIDNSRNIKKYSKIYLKTKKRRISKLDSIRDDALG